MAGHIATADRTDWCSPEKIWGPVQRFYGGRIELDPCSNDAVEFSAVATVKPPEDGLAIGWAGKVYCNPPYGDGLSRWVEKCANEYLQGRAQVILLLPAAVDTRHWQGPIYTSAAAVCYIQGRLKFVGAAASAPMATALVYWGHEGDRFCRFFEDMEDLGHCERL